LEIKTDLVLKTISILTFALFAVLYAQLVFSVYYK